MRIKYIIPFPFDVGQDIRSAQVPDDLLGEGTHVECVPVRNTATLVDCYYEDLIFEMYIVEAGLRAEEEGYDAVVMDTVSDSGLAALRSRLSIPVLGPGLVSYAVAIMLGRRFSIITMWEQWRHLYIKNLDTYHLWDQCASVRAAGIRPEPAVSVPSAKATRPAATATAEPELDPPAIWLRLRTHRGMPYGERVPVSPVANWSMLHFPTRTAPASRRRRTATASSAGP